MSDTVLENTIEKVANDFESEVAATMAAALGQN